MTTNNTIRELDALEADFEAKVRDVRDKLSTRAGELRAELHEIEATIEDCDRRLEVARGPMTADEMAELIAEHVPKGTYMPAAEMCGYITEATGDHRASSTHVNNVYHRGTGLLKRKKKPKGQEGRHRFLYSVQG